MNHSGWPSRQCDVANAGGPSGRASRRPATSAWARRRRKSRSSARWRSTPVWNGAPNAVAFSTRCDGPRMRATPMRRSTSRSCWTAAGGRRATSQAAVWYARAAAAGDRRAAFNLGQLYERGDGVPANADLSRAWYAAADLPAARQRATEVKEPPHRPTRLLAPKPLFPPNGSSLRADLDSVELVWTSSLEPEPVRYFVELRRFDAKGSAEQWSGFVDVSSLRLPLSSDAGTLAWRVTAVARGDGDYLTSDWSIICRQPSNIALGIGCKFDAALDQTGR